MTPINSDHLPILVTKAQEKGSNAQKTNVLKQPVLQFPKQTEPKAKEKEILGKHAEDTKAKLEVMDVKWTGIHKEIEKMKVDVTNLKQKCTNKVGLKRITGTTTS